MLDAAEANDWINSNYDRAAAMQTEIVQADVEFIVAEDLDLFTETGFRHGMSGLQRARAEALLERISAAMEEEDKPRLEYEAALAR